MYNKFKANESPTIDIKAESVITVPNSTPLKEVDLPHDNNKTSSENLDGRNITILRSQTGSGKTHAMIRGAIQHASMGGISIIAFPNLNLLNENKVKIKALLDRKYQSWNISLREMSLNEQFSGKGETKPEIILRDLRKGRLIYLTLHVYLHQRGDFGHFSKFFRLLQPFRSITKIFIDEGHLYIEKFQKNYKINNLTISDSELADRSTPITSNKVLEEQILKGKNEIKISKQMLFAQKRTFDGNNMGFELTLKKDIVLGTSINIIKKEDLNNIFENQPPELDSNLVKDSETQSGLAKFDFNSIDVDDPDSLALIIKEINHNAPYPVVKDLSIIEPNKIVLPYYRVHPVSITGDLEKDIKIKNFLTQHYQKVFDFNSYLNIMTTSEGANFIPCFNKYTKSGNKDNINFSLKDPKLIDEIIQNVLYFNKVFIENYKNHNKDSDNAAFQHNLKTIETDLDKIGSNFADVFVNIQNELDEITPSTEEEALTMNFILSKNCYLISYNPVYSDSKKSVYDFNEYKNCVQRKNVITKNLQDINKTLETTNDEEEKKKLDESIVNLQNEIKNSKFNYQKEVCFTSELTLFSMPELYILSHFQTVILLSATYSAAMISQIYNYFDNINFIDIPNMQPKLKKLVLISSHIDWFANKKPEWQQGWGSLAEHFKENVWGDVDDNNDHKHGLLLTPTNDQAERFFQYGINTKKELFSLIKGTEERTSTNRHYMQDEITDSNAFVISPGDASKVFRISSILSTVSVGLNMPQHVFIIASANTYKPISTVWKYGDVNLNDARNYETIMSLLQAIGRNARRSEQEKEKEEDPLRIILISKANTFQNTIPIIVEYSLNLYEEVEVCDISFFEGLISTRFRSENLFKKYVTGLSILEKVNSELHKKLSFILNWDNKETLRFSLIKQILRVYKEPDLNIKEILENYIKFANFYRLYALFLYLTLYSYNFHIKFLNNKDDQEKLNALFDKSSKNKISTTILQKALNYNRWSEYGGNNIEENKTAEGETDGGFEKEGPSFDSEAVAVESFSEAAPAEAYPEGEPAEAYPNAAPAEAYPNYETPPNLDKDQHVILDLNLLVKTFTNKFNDSVTNKEAYIEKYGKLDENQVFDKVLNENFSNFLF